MPTPETMRAAVYRGPHDLRVEVLPVPEIGPGEILVRVAACGVCGTDLKKIHYGLQSPPRVYGHETVGRIAAVGSEVDGWRVGDRVALYHHVPCGECHYCRRGVPAQCDLYRRTGVTAGFTPAGGGYAEYVKVMDWVVRGGGVVRVPESVSDRAAVFVEPVNTCLKAVQRAALQEGDLALVIGAGPIGLLLMQLASLAGARTVVSDLLPGRKTVAARLGATRIVSPGEAHDAVMALTADRGADAVFVAVPSTDVVGPALTMTRPGGRVVLFAHTRRGDECRLDAGEICTLDKVVIGSYSSDIGLAEEAARVVFERRIEVESLVTHEFPLDRIGDALTTASQPSDESLKVVVTL